MGDPLYPDYEDINGFIYACFDAAKVTDPFDCDGYTPAEMTVMSIRQNDLERIDRLEALLDRAEKQLSHEVACPDICTKCEITAATSKERDDD